MRELLSFLVDTILVLFIQQSDDYRVMITASYTHAIFRIEHVIRN